VTIHGPCWWAWERTGFGTGMQRCMTIAAECGAAAARGNIHRRIVHASCEVMGRPARGGFVRPSTMRTPDQMQALEAPCGALQWADANERKPEIGHAPSLSVRCSVSQLKRRVLQTVAQTVSVGEWMVRRRLKP
jgi:hypothetical protein